MDSGRGRVAGSSAAGGIRRHGPGKQTGEWQVRRQPGTIRTPGIYQVCDVVEGRRAIFG